MSADPAFYFDLASPESYVAAERVIGVMPVPCEWIGIVAADLPGNGPPAWDAEQLAGLAALAAQRGLQPLRVPEPFPFDSLMAMRVATYAKQIGRVVPFALAAFRQAFAGGHALDDADRVIVAAAACEMHPTAVLKATELHSVTRALTEATAVAGQRGVRCVPAFWTGAEIHHGDAALEDAAAALAPTR